MKKSNVAALAILLILGSPAYADKEQAARLSAQDRQNIIWAIRILADTKTLVKTENQCAQFDTDILDLLKQDGLLENGGVELNSICIDPVEK